MVQFFGGMTIDDLIIHLCFVLFFLQWAEYVLFAALLFAVCIIFSIMAYFYTYIDPNEIEAQLDEEEKQVKKDPDLQEKEEKEAEAVSRM